MSLDQRFAVMQSVKVTNAELADHGLVGSVRSDQRPSETDRDVTVVDVMLDDPAEPGDGQRLVTFDVNDLTAL